MTQQARGPRVHERWAHLRFSVIGQLLAAPPPKGELRAQIEALAGRQWRHPITGEPARFGFSTIERWFYRALKERSDPVGVLRRKLRTDAGQLSHPRGGRALPHDRDQHDYRGEIDLAPEKPERRRRSACAARHGMVGAVRREG